MHSKATKIKLQQFNRVTIYYYYYYPSVCVCTYARYFPGFPQ